MPDPTPHHGPDAGREYQAATTDAIGQHPNLSGASAANSVLTDVRKAINRVRNKGILATLTNDELYSILPKAKLISVPPGKELRTSGEGIYVVTEGKVKCSLVDQAGSHYPLSEGVPGQVFGEIKFLLCPNTKHQGKVFLKAMTPVEAIEFSAKSFMLTIGNSMAALNFLLREQVARLAAIDRFAAQAVGLSPEKMESLNFSERAADWLKSRIGSWRFLIGATSAGVAYAIVNTVAGQMGFSQVDEFPYIFLNLILSAASGATVPILLISDRRQAQIHHNSQRAMNETLLGLRRDIDKLLSEHGPQDLSPQDRSPQDPDSTPH